MTDNEKSPAVRKQPSKLPLFNVVLLNDDDHSHEYVVEMLHSIFGYPVEMGFHLEPHQVDSLVAYMIRWRAEGAS